MEETPSDMVDITHSNPSTSLGDSTKSPTKPVLNMAVFEELQWTPALEVSEANSTKFKAIRDSANDSSARMGHENASWRKMSICSPPVTDLLVFNGIIDQEIPYLRLSKGSPAGNISTGSRVETMMLDYQTFPHNEGKEVGGITFEDLLYGLRAHYLENYDLLETVYEDMDLNDEDAGKWKPELIVTENEVLKLDVGILLW